MSYLCLCDICEQIIKEGENKSVLAMNEIKEENGRIKLLTAEDFISRLQSRNKDIRFWEICSKCKVLLDKFLAMRIKDLKKIEEELKSLEEKE